MAKKEKEEKEDLKIEEEDQSKVQEDENPSESEESSQDGEDECEDDELAKLKKDLEAKDEEIIELKSHIQRLQADFDNFRKQNDKQKQDLIKFANEGLIVKFLDVYEDMERALENSTNEEELREGLELIYSKMKNTLEKEGVEEIPAVGEKFDPFKHEKIAVSEHLSVEFIHTLHSIPGNNAILVRTPNGTIYVSGDWRTESNPLYKQTDYERIDEIVKKEGITLMLNESTNIDSPGHHPHSEYDVGENLGKVMDHYANGRIIVSCFSSQVSRIGMVLDEAAKRGRKVAFAGFSMINNVEVALRTHQIKAPKDTIMKMEDIIKLPDEMVTIICTGSQGELNAVLNRMVTGAHKYIKIKSSDTIVFSSNPIPGNEPHVVSTVDGLLREGAQVIQNGKTHLTNIGPLHLSGHAYYEDHVDFVTRLQPLNYMPYHGEFYMMQHNAEMAENVIGIPKDRIIISDDGDIVELTKDKKIKKSGRVHVGNKLFDDADMPVHEAVVKDRIHISREGIFIIVLTLSKKTGRLIKTPDIVSRAFIYLDNSEELIGKIRHYLRVKTDKSVSTDPELKVLKDEIKEDVTRILFDATGHTPIVIPVINKV